MSDESVLYGTPPPEPPAAPLYPVTLDLDAPPEVGRLSTFFRLILAIPLFILLAILGSGFGSSPYFLVGFGVSGALVLFYWITVLVRGRPVGWVFDALVELQRFVLRANAYLLLITDKYPPFDGDSALTYGVQRPERLQRKQVFLWKTLASIPHIFVLVILWFAVAVCVVIAWVAIIFTGRYPLGLRGFVVGWLRWVARLNAYWVSLTDDFPPFSLSSDVGPATRQAHVVSGLGGLVLAGGGAGLIALAVLASGQSRETLVSYDSLLDGEESESLVIDDIEVRLVGAEDPYEFSDELFVPDRGNRFVAIAVLTFNGSAGDRDFFEGDFMLESEDGDDHDPDLVSFGGAAGARSLPEGATGLVTVIFQMTNSEDAQAFEYQPGFPNKARFEFE